MSDYQRTTRICTLNDLPPSLATALGQRAQDLGIKDLSQQILLCAETTSVKTKRSGLIARWLHALAARRLCDRRAVLFQLTGWPYSHQYCSAA